jgi:hypothetical protein
MAAKTHQKHILMDSIKVETKQQKVSTNLKSRIPIILQHPLSNHPPLYLRLNVQYPNLMLSGIGRKRTRQWRKTKHKDPEQQECRAEECEASPSEGEGAGKAEHFEHKEEIGVFGFGTDGMEDGMERCIEYGWEGAGITKAMTHAILGYAELEAR